MALYLRPGDGEAFSLTWGAFDFRAGTATVYMSKVKTRKTVYPAEDYMAEAEDKIEDGATRKEWVIGMIRTSANRLDYDITDREWGKISDMIDKLCEMARTVNSDTATKEAKMA